MLYAKTFLFYSSHTYRNTQTHRQTDRETDSEREIDENDYVLEEVDKHPL